MAILTYPLNGILYDAEDAEIYNCTRTSGVFAEEGHFTASVTGEDRIVTIGPGIAWMQNEEFHGKAIYNPEDVDLTIDTADSVYARIDRIVLQFDKVANMTQLVVKKGTPAQEPVPPDITRDGYVYELGIYNITSRASTPAIDVEDVSSTIMDESVCGLMRDGVTRLPTQDLYNQWLAWFESIQAEATEEENNFLQWIADVKDATTTQIASDQKELEDWIADIENTTQQQLDIDQEAFEEWFKNLVYVLDGDVAGHLEVEIELAQEAADSALEQIAKNWVDGYLVDENDNALLCDPENSDTKVIMISRAICSCTSISGGGASTTAIATQEQVQTAVDRYLDDNPVTVPAIDTTLTKSGEAADAKTVGDRLGDLEEKIPVVAAISESYIRSLFEYD